jgi:hypothetical protein
MTPTLSTCAAEKATLRLQAARLSVPDELYWYNNNTNWDSLSRKEFRDLMIRMETITVQFYNDACAASRYNRSAAIKTFWADEWGCEYLPESGRWLDLATGTFIVSETEKKAKKEAKKEAKKALKKQRRRPSKRLSTTMKRRNCMRRQCNSSNSSNSINPMITTIGMMRRRKHMRRRMPARGPSKSNKSNKSSKSSKSNSNSKKPKRIWIHYLTAGLVPVPLLKPRLPASRASRCFTLRRSM